MNATYVAKDDRFNELDTETDFRSTTPGEVSVGHIVVFLMDPIKTIRIDPNFDQPGNLKLEFGGKHVPPWSTFTEHLQNILYSGGPVRDYRKMSVYYSKCKQLTKIFWKLERISGIRCNCYPCQLCDEVQQRIRGDVGAI
jgi:hypothetical protein